MIAVALRETFQQKVLEPRGSIGWFNFGVLMTHTNLFVCFLDCFFPVLFCLVDFDCFRVSLLFQFQLMISSSIASYTLIESSRER